MSEVGYIKLFRQMRENPVVYKDADHIAVWVELLITAQFHPSDVFFGNQRITLQPGQLITGRKKIADKLGVSESKVQRILKCFESEHMIEQQTDNRKRLITIVSWSKFQQGEQQNEQQVNSNRTASEQQVNTYKEIKKERNKEYHHHSSGEGKAISDMTEEEKNAFHQRAMKRFYGEQI